MGNFEVTMLCFTVIVIIGFLLFGAYMFFKLYKCSHEWKEEICNVWGKKENKYPIARKYIYTCTKCKKMKVTVV